MPRANSVQEVFDAMPAHFLPEQAAGVRAVIQFDVSGDGGGQWYATIADGTLHVTPGQSPAPSVSLATSAKDYLAIVNGELKPMSAFMQGKLKVKGNMPLLMKMQSLFSI